MRSLGEALSLAAKPTFERMQHAMKRVRQIDPGLSSEKRIRRFVEHIEQSPNALSHYRQSDRRQIRQTINLYRQTELVYRVAGRIQAQQSLESQPLHGLLNFVTTQMKEFQHQGRADTTAFYRGSKSFLREELNRSESVHSVALAQPIGVAIPQGKNPDDVVVLFNALLNKHFPGLMRRHEEKKPRSLSEEEPQEPLKQEGAKEQRLSSWRGVSSFAEIDEVLNGTFHGTILDEGRVKALRADFEEKLQQAELSDAASLTLSERPKAKKSVSWADEGQGGKPLTTEIPIGWNPKERDRSKGETIRRTGGNIRNYDKPPKRGTADSAQGEKVAIQEGLHQIMEMEKRHHRKAVKIFNEEFEKHFDIHSSVKDIEEVKKFMREAFLAENSERPSEKLEQFYVAFRERIRELDSSIFSRLFG